MVCGSVEKENGSRGTLYTCQDGLRVRYRSFSIAELVPEIHNTASPIDLSPAGVVLRISALNLYLKRDRNPAEGYIQA
jgi:hypothetical protein